GFLRDVGRLLPLLGLAIGVDDLLIAALRVVIAQRDHLAERIDCSLTVVVIAVNGSQPLKENCAISFFTRGVAGIGLFGFLQQVLQNLDRIVVTSLRLIDGGDVVGNFD